MHRFRPLRIAGSPGDLEALFLRVDERCPSHWHRDHSRDRDGGLGGRQIYFLRAAKDGLPQVRLGLLMHDAAEGLQMIDMTSLLPTSDRVRLTEEQDSLVVDDFIRGVLQPSIGSRPITVSTQPLDVDITTFVNHDSVLKRLRRFSSAANKSSGRSHPMDSKRWLDFVIAAHEHRVDIPIDVFTDWLVTDGWPARTADDLVRDHEYGRQLLQRYEEPRREN